MRARVSATGDQAQKTVVTDVDGRFILPLRSGIVPGDIVAIRVQKKGYRTYEEMMPAASSLPRRIHLVPVELPNKSKPKVQKLVHLTFKDAPEFTPAREQIIINDVSRMHDYFVSLEIPTPSVLPPFTVTDGLSAFTPPLQYRGDLSIPRSAIKDRKVATSLYAQYVLQKVLAEKNAVPEPFDGPHIQQLQQQTFFLMTLRDYFQSSFWDAVKQNKFPPATVLWKIRSSLGKRFTDRLASFILRELADTPQETFDPDMNVSFVKELKVG